MADLTIGYIGTRGAGEFDNTRTAVNETLDNNIRCVCHVRPSTYDCDGAYMSGEITWRVWKTKTASTNTSAMDEDTIEVVLAATEDAENLKLYVMDWADTANTIRDVFVMFPLNYPCSIELIEDTLFENALAQARSIQMRTRGTHLREELLEAARESINLPDTLAGLGYNISS